MDSEVPTCSRFLQDSGPRLDKCLISDVCMYSIRYPSHLLVCMSCILFSFSFLSTCISISAGRKSRSFAGVSLGEGPE